MTLYRKRNGGKLALVVVAFKRVKFITINCEQCGQLREIQTQDRFHVRRCKECQKEKNRLKAMAHYEARKLAKKNGGQTKDNTTVVSVEGKRRGRPRKNEQ